jgi:hypothetical protein
MARITVTQLKCAVADPAWRKAWLAGKIPSTFAFAKGVNGRVFGTRFHQETDRLVKWLTSPEHLKEGAAIDSAEELLDIVWRSSLQGFTDDSSPRTKRTKHSPSPRASGVIAKG